MEWWSGITAGKLNGTAIISSNNWVYDSNGKHRIYFRSNGTTYYQGYNGNGTYNTNSEIQQEQQ